MEIAVEEKPNDHLSCEIKFNRDRSKAWIGQPHQIKKIMNTFGDEIVKLQKHGTPGTPGQQLIIPTDKAAVIGDKQHHRCRSGVGMLMHLIKHSRPDISNSVRQLTKPLDGPTQAAHKEMLRVMKCAIDTKELGLKIEPTGDECLW